MSWLCSANGSVTGIFLRDEDPKVEEVQGCYIFVQEKQTKSVAVACENGLHFVIGR